MVSGAIDIFELECINEWLQAIGHGLCRVWVDYEYGAHLGIPRIATVPIFAHGGENVVASIFYNLPHVKIEAAARDGDPWMQPCGAAGQGLARGDVTGSRGYHKSQAIKHCHVSGSCVGRFHWKISGITIVGMMWYQADRQIGLSMKNKQCQLCFPTKGPEQRHRKIMLVWYEVGLRQC
jgi:hypothetical protein